MPKSVREWAKRKLRSSRKQVDWIGRHLAEIEPHYAKGYVEIHQGIMSGLEMCAILDNLIEKVDNII